MDKNNTIQPVPARRVDGYLSRKAQELDQSALVYCETGFEFVAEGRPMVVHELWTLERKGHDSIGLGGNFGNAKLAIECLLRSGLPGVVDNEATRETAKKLIEYCAKLIETEGWNSYDDSVNAKKHSENLALIIRRINPEKALGE